MRGCLRADRWIDPGEGTSARRSVQGRSAPADHGVRRGIAESAVLNGGGRTIHGTTRGPAARLRVRPSRTPIRNRPLRNGGRVATHKDRETEPGKVRSGAGAWPEPPRSAFAVQAGPACLGSASSHRQASPSRAASKWRVWMRTRGAAHPVTLAIQAGPPTRA